MGTALLKILLLITIICGTAHFSHAQRRNKDKETQPANTDSVSVRLDNESAVAEGMKFVMKDEPERALIIFQKLATDKPTDAALQYLLAKTLLKLEKLNDALEPAKKAYELNKNNEFYAQQLGEIYAKKRKYGESAQVYEELVRKYPSNIQYGLELAGVYVFNDQYDKAIEAYNLLEKSIGITEEITRQKQQLYLRQNKLEKALEEARKLIASEPGEVGYRVELAELLIANERLAEAVVPLEEALKINPDESQAHVLLADIYRKKGDIERCNKELKAVFANPNLDSEPKIRVLSGYLKMLKTEKEAATSWQFESAVVAVTAAAAACYLAGVLTVRLRGEPWAPSRTLAFLGGLVLWVVVCCSGIGVYETVLFTDRAVQAVLLLMVVPLLLALGAPVSLLVQAAPVRLQVALEGALSGRFSRVLMFPLVSTVLLIVPPWLFYFTSWYARSLTDPAWNTAFHLAFVAAGLAYFWPRLQIDPVPRHYHPLLGVVITVAEVIFDAALGCVLVFGGHLLAAHYWHTLNRPWGWAPAQDQKWGGAVLWGLGDIAGVPFMAALIARVLKEERARTKAVDEQLDREELAAASIGPAPREEDRTPSPQLPDPARPWWETDPRLAYRYGHGPGQDT